jgi:hypothetical protein
LTGCSPAARLPADEGFRRIQVEEARIAEAAAQLVHTDGCAETKPLEERICRHAAELCRLAGQLSDPDAATRCARGQESCAAARERASVPCATPAQHDS